MKIAFLIAAHAYPDLLNALIKQLLDDPSCDIYLHIDVKSGNLPEQVESHPRVSILEDRYSVFWGDISQIHAAMSLLTAAWQSGREYDYYCYCSGQDLHVRPGFKAHLQRHEGRSFITWKPDRPPHRNGFTAMRWPQMFKRNFKGLHPLRVCRSLLIRLARLGVTLRPNRCRLPDSHVLCVGSAWFTLHREAVGYIVETNPHREAYHAFFSEILMPEERFFQTVLVNSPLAPTLINDNLLYTVFVANSPKDLTMKDMPEIMASGCFMARKFNPKVDRDVIDHYVAQTPFARDAHEAPV